jgi:hypothetical protein
VSGCRTLSAVVITIRYSVARFSLCLLARVCCGEPLPHTATP